MKRLFLILSLTWVTLFAANSQAQSVTTYTGTIKDLSNATVTSGKVTFTLKPGIDTSVSGTARFVPQVVTCKITDAGLRNEDDSGACTVIANTSLTPAGTYFQVDICPEFVCSSRFNTFSIGGTVDISTLAPSPSTTPVYNIAHKNESIAWEQQQTFIAGAVTKALNGKRFADQFLGVDACVKIAAAIADLPSTGGVVDATGFVGNQNCSVNPFTGVTKSGQLLLGAATFRTTVKWQTPAGLKWQVIGTGRGDSGAHNTAIQAVTGFPTDGTPLVQIGGSTPGLATHGTTFENLTIDCNGIAKTGPFSADANEMSGLKRVDIAKCSAKGYDFASMAETGSAQNFVIDEVEVYPMAYGTASTVCGSITGYFSGPQQVSNVTCFANPSAPSDNCFTIDRVSTGRFTSLHGEHCGKVVNIGSTYVVDGISLDNTNGGPGTTTIIEINNSSSQNIIATNTVRNGADYSVVNNASAKSYTDDKLSWYFYGNGSLPRTECSSSSGGNACLLGNMALLGPLNLNGFGLLDGTSIPARAGVIRLGSGQFINFNNYADSADVNGISKDNSDVVQVGGTAGVKVVGPLTVTGALDATSLKVSGAALASSNLSDVNALAKTSGTPVVNKAACIKTVGPPVVLGYCSTVVDSAGACTCN